MWTPQPIGRDINNGAGVFKGALWAEPQGLRLCGLDEEYD